MYIGFPTSYFAFSFLFVLAFFVRNGNFSLALSFASALRGIFVSVIRWCFHKLYVSLNLPFNPTPTFFIARKSNFAYATKQVVGRVMFGPVISRR